MQAFPNALLVCPFAQNQRVFALNASPRVAADLATAAHSCNSVGWCDIEQLLLERLVRFFVFTEFASGDLWNLHIFWFSHT